MFWMDGGGFSLKMSYEVVPLFIEFGVPFIGSKVNFQISSDRSPQHFKSTLFLQEIYVTLF